MPHIIIDNHDRICFYGNPAGYLQENKAVVDPMFQNAELERWLTVKNHFEVEWQAGVFDKLASGWNFAESAEQLKNVRIWQLKPDADIRMKFIGYDALIDKFCEPTHDSYRVAFDGTAGTNNLEEIYDKFNADHPVGFHGHSLTMSDVVELYDTNGSEFYYVDHFDFKAIDFVEPQEQQQNQSMEMQF